MGFRSTLQQKQNFATKTKLFKKEIQV